jgi:hypothetical protein
MWTSVVGVLIATLAAYAYAGRLEAVSMASIVSWLGGGVLITGVVIAVAT